ncbi:MAG: hypothetical protein RL095_2140 [Verrucomicrobiota bacterium]|jgi:DNA sulfur modification protein DndE
MIVETVRVSQRARDHLIALKRHTKIENWNVLCRWALMVSLKNPDRPTKSTPGADSNIEMSWRTFAGANDEVITALVKQRCVIDGIDPNPENYAEELKLHLQRGITALFANKEIKSIADLVELAL